MEIRFNTISEDVEKVLESIDKHNRKFFVETAILHYIKHLESDSNAIDLFYNSRKKQDSELQFKPSELECNNVNELNIKDNKPKATKAVDNSSLGADAW